MTFRNPNQLLVRKLQSYPNSYARLLRSSATSSLVLCLHWLRINKNFVIFGIDSSILGQWSFHRIPPLSVFFLLLHLLRCRHSSFLSFYRRPWLVLSFTYLTRSIIRDHDWFSPPSLGLHIDSFENLPTPATSSLVLRLNWLRINIKLVIVGIDSSILGQWSSWINTSISIGFPLYRSSSSWLVLSPGPKLSDNSLIAAPRSSWFACSTEIDLYKLHNPPISPLSKCSCYSRLQASVPAADIEACSCLFRASVAPLRSLLRYEAIEFLNPNQSLLSSPSLIMLFINWILQKHVNNLLMYSSYYGCLKNSTGCCWYIELIYDIGMNVWQLDFGGLLR